MDGEAEFSGRTVEDAIAQAEGAFRSSRDELTVEIVSPGRSGVFGIGAEQATVRAVRKNGHSTPTRAETETAEDQELPAAGGAVDDQLIEAAQEVLRNLLDRMGFDADVSVRSEVEPLMLGISGDNLGILIGRRGDNLSALQFMVNLILSKNRRQWPRVVIDVENYRARREDSLRELAGRIAERVEQNQRAFTLEAMPASDRRIIHLTLRERTNIETFSIGEGANRRVVVAPQQVTQSDDGAESEYA